MANELLDSNIYNATVINNPTGDNNPILKFKLSNGNYIEKEYNYGKINWAKGQTFFVKYDNQKMKVIKKYALEKIYLAPIIATPVISILIIIYLLISNKFSALIENFISPTSILIVVLTVVLSMIVLPCIIYYAREHNFKNNCNKKTKGRIISFVPIFKMHNTSTYINNCNRAYYELEWRALLEFKTYNGTVCRTIENDKLFEGDRNVLTHKLKINDEVSIKYNESNPNFAFIDDTEYSIQFEEYKGKGTKAKIVDKETIIYESIDKENKELEECFKQDYLICEYTINNEIYRKRTLFPVNTNMFSIGQEISIRCNINNLKEFNVSYLVF